MVINTQNKLHIMLKLCDIQIRNVNLQNHKSQNAEYNLKIQQKCCD